MTILKVIGIIILFFILPFLTGNLYSLIFRKKKIGAIEDYFRGMICIYAGLFALQLFIIKLQFDFEKVTKLYHLYFALMGIGGLIAFIIRFFGEKREKVCSFKKKSSLILFGLILIQGILYIVVKNPYFENNALWETTRTILESGTLYECDAFTGEWTALGFPLSNKLMFLPVLYAYLSKIFGIKIHLIFNFVLPFVTFLSYYMVMHLWSKHLVKDYQIPYGRSMLCIIFLTQIGDFWTETTAFRVLHSGYMGEAIFFGGIFLYALYEIKNKCYSIVAISLLTIPGLMKYDLFFDFLKEIPKYFRQYVYGGGMLAVYIVAGIYLIGRQKKIKSELLNLNLTIAILLCAVWEKAFQSTWHRWKKWCSVVVVAAVLLLSGNLTFISLETEFRSNVFGMEKEEYELLCTLEENADDKTQLWVQGHTQFSKWIRRAGNRTKTKMARNIEAESSLRYSFEPFDEREEILWYALNHPTDFMEENLMEAAKGVPMDYLVIEKITDILPIQENEKFQYVFATSSYLVYQVDKR